MKQDKLIEALQRAATQCSQPLHISSDHHGRRLSTPFGSVRLGPDRRQEIHPRFYGRYLKNLGLS